MSTKRMKPAAPAKRGRPAKPANSSKSRVVTIRVTERELDGLRAAAKEADVTVSDLILSRTIPDIFRNF